MTITYSRPVISNPITAGMLTVAMMQWINQLNHCMNNEFRHGVAYQVAGEIADIVLAKVDFGEFDDSNGTFDEQYARYSEEGDALIGGNITKALEPLLDEMSQSSNVPFDLLINEVDKFLAARGIPLNA